MNTPDPKTLANVAKTIQSGGPGNTRTTGFNGNIEDWHLSDVASFEKEALVRAEALQTALPPTPFDENLMLWAIKDNTDKERASLVNELKAIVESANNRKKIVFFDSNDTPAGP